MQPAVESWPGSRVVQSLSGIQEDDPLTSENISEAEIYRNLMFELAGDGDPLRALGEMPKEVRSILESAGDDLRIRPAEGEWSVIELLFANFTD
jgi:hypothetical protein